MKAIFTTKDLARNTHIIISFLTFHKSLKIDTVTFHSDDIDEVDAA